MFIVLIKNYKSILETNYYSKYEEDSMDSKYKITNVIKNYNLNSKISDILFRAYKYIIQNEWRGACHACSSAIYVALCELGLKPTLCIGEAKKDNYIFDHSLIELNDKVIDIPICMTLQSDYSNISPVIMNIEIDRNIETSIEYGIYKNGLDLEAGIAYTMPFVEYMDSFPSLDDNGLWNLVEILLEQRIDVSILRKKYNNVKRIYKKV